MSPTSLAAPPTPVVPSVSLEGIPREQPLYALGATWTGDGTTFRVFSSVADGVELCLFDDDGAEQRIAMRSEQGFLWAVSCPGIGPGQAYGFRVHGPYEPERGVRCNPAKVLVDPYARAIARQRPWGPGMFPYDMEADDLVIDTTDNAAWAPRGFVVDPRFDWGDDQSPRHSSETTVIYELHVKGFTKRLRSVPAAQQGTFAALASPAAIAHLKDLGITSVELMPVHAFTHEPHLLEQGLSNYWGYHTLGFFAPHAEYSASGERGEQVTEFKSMVKALHAAGIEVLLDVVYNHTAEGNHLGPLLSLKGFDNPAYYHLMDAEPRYYRDFTGTGNSVNLRHPFALQLVMDSLRYWVQEMHVDGFRFDLASTLARDGDVLDTWSAFFATIHQDPVLHQVKLIAEPWDTGDNGYQVGNFPFRWAEWNDRYRDTVREFWTGSGAKRAELAGRLTGSADLFQNNGRRPWASINYVSSHDGLTLRDLAEADAGADAAPQRQRNLLATVLLSIGTPMITAGDELGRTQRGDDNAYNQDNEISWMDWAGADRSLCAFTKDLLAVRRSLPFLTSPDWPGTDGKVIRWRCPDGQDLTEDDWQNGDAHLALWMTAAPAEVMIIFNAHGEEVTYQLPTLDGRGWRRVLDTSPAADTSRDLTACTVPAHSVSLCVAETRR